MNQILTLVDRTTGRSTSMVFDGTITTANLTPVLEANIAKEARLITDDARHYSLSARTLQLTASLPTPAANMSAATTPRSRRTRSKAFSAFSNAGCAGFISIAASNTCTGIWPNLISATRTARPPAATIPTRPTLHCWHRWASSDVC